MARIPLSGCALSLLIGLSSLDADREPGDPSCQLLALSYGMDYGGGNATIGVFVRSGGSWTQSTPTYRLDTSRRIHAPLTPALARSMSRLNRTTPPTCTHCSEEATTAASAAPRSRPIQSPARQAPEMVFPPAPTLATSTTQRRTMPAANAISLAEFVVTERDRCRLMVLRP